MTQHCPGSKISVLITVTEKGGLLDLESHIWPRVKIVNGGSQRFLVLPSTYNLIS